VREPDAEAENRAQAALLANDWKLRCGRSNPAVLIAEKGYRSLYGS
jgi:hypothetical protein